MRVRLIDSLHGVRRRRRGWGLNAIPTDRRDAASQALDDATEPLAQIFLRLERKAEAGELPLYEANRLEDAYFDIQNRVQAHLDRLANATTDTAFAEWTRQADALAAEAQALHTEIGEVIGFEEQTRTLKLVVYFGGAVLLLGGFAWVIAKKGKRR
jgi:hypothetical protein